jgi:hypothetical protein
MTASARNPSRPAIRVPRDSAARTATTPSRRAVMAIGARPVIVVLKPLILTSACG